MTGLGGYQILNLEGSYTEGVATIEGAYGKATAGKAILLQGGGLNTQFIPAAVAVEGTVTISADGKTITITDEDVVTITEESEGE